MLNLDTGRVSPQFHVINDDFFETIALQDKIRTNWKRLAGFALVQLTVPSPPSFTPPLAIVPSDPLPVMPQEPDAYMPSPDVTFRPIDEQPPEQAEVSAPQLCRSTRNHQPTRTMLESVTQQDLDFQDFSGPYTLRTIAFNAEHQTYYESMHEDDYKLQNELEDLIVILTPPTKDILYYRQTMKTTDRREFQRTMQKEFNDHSARTHWDLFPIDQVPEGEKVMDSVWAMKRKRNIITNEIYKWKARLNLHGGQ